MVTSWADVVFCLVSQPGISIQSVSVMGLLFECCTIRHCHCFEQSQFPCDWINRLEEELNSFNQYNFLITSALYSKYEVDQLEYSFVWSCRLHSSWFFPWFSHEFWPGSEERQLAGGFDDSHGWHPRLALQIWRNRSGEVRLGGLMCAIFVDDLYLLRLRWMWLVSSQDGGSWELAISTEEFWLKFCWSPWAFFKVSAPGYLIFWQTQVETLEGLANFLTETSLFLHWSTPDFPICEPDPKTHLSIHQEWWMTSIPFGSLT